MTDGGVIQKQSFMKTSGVYLIFSLSGASALIYQAIWARWLSLVFGNTTLSVSIVLGNFMTGLALGSWLAGRLLNRVKNPMRSYAFLELGIGVFAFCFPLLTRSMDLLFTSLVTSESLTLYSIVVRALLSAAALLVPTTFMGATLPLLTDFFHRSPRHTHTWRVGLLYAANTFGAAVGIVLASFILIELIGVLATTFFAAGLNLLVAAIGYVFSRGGDLMEIAAGPAGKRRLDNPGRFALVVITLSGAAALASEVLWTRTLETVVGNSTYAFATMVLLYLLGIAAGSWIMSLVVNRLRALPLWLASMQLGMGLWTLASLWLFERIIDAMAVYSIHVVAEMTSKTMVSMSTVVAYYVKAVCVLFPLALFSGACFPLATRIIDPEDEEAQGALVAKTYSWNTVGAVLGSFAAGFVVAPQWDYFNSLYVLAASYCVIAAGAFLLICMPRGQVSRRTHTAVVLGSLSVLVVVFSVVAAWDGTSYVKRQSARHPARQVVFHEPGLQGVTSVLKNRTNPFFGDMLLVNGLGMTVKITDTKMMAHLPMLLHPDPENTLVICLGMGTTYRSAISHGKKVTVVELVKEVVTAFDYFFDDAAAAKSYPRGRIVVNDGRNFLKLTKEKFDVITIDPPPPIDAAGVNNLYSREFMELARDHLNKGGIMAHWMPNPGVLSGVDDLETLSTLVSTFAQVFPYTYVHTSFRNVGLHVIGSLDPITISPDEVRGRLSRGTVMRDLYEWDNVPPDFLTSGWQAVGQPDRKAPVITDNNPNLEFYLIRTVKKGGKKIPPLNFW